MCYKMSLIEAPKLVSIKQKRKKEKSCREWRENFSTHCRSNPQRTIDHTGLESILIIIANFVIIFI